jgi:hypothetical protein
MYNNDFSISYFQQEKGRLYLEFCDVKERDQSELSYKKANREHSNSANRKLLFSITVCALKYPCPTFRVITRAVDPDPRGSALVSWIRIRIQEGKMTHENRKKFEKFHVFK